MKQLAIIPITLLILSVMMTTTVTASALNYDPKELCEDDYKGEWKNSKCYLDDKDDLAHFEDDVCYDQNLAADNPEICD